jgi:hypothetical protein
MVSSPNIFSQTRVRTFSASARLASLRVRFVVAGSVRFWAGYPYRIMPRRYTAPALPAGSERPKEPFW